MYEVLANRIDQLYPDLLFELDHNDLPEGKEHFFTLGNFAEVKEQECLYHIYMLMDHADAGDDIKLTGALAHEYGHFLCRTYLYPNLPGLGHIILWALQSRQPFQKSDKFTINFILLIEELIAWLIAWGLLLKLNSLSWAHLQYGWRSWKTYWSRIRPWIIKN